MGLAACHSKLACHPCVPMLALGTLQLYNKTCCDSQACKLAHHHVVSCHLYAKGSLSTAPSHNCLHVHCVSNVCILVNSHDCPIRIYRHYLHVIQNLLSMKISQMRGISRYCVRKWPLQSVTFSSDSCLLVNVPSDTFVKTYPRWCAYLQHMSTHTSVLSTLARVPMRSPGISLEPLPHKKSWKSGMFVV